jgi:DNA-binding CsgD family transcriptional regulator
LANVLRYPRPLLWTTTALAMLEHSLGNAAAAWATVEPLVERVEQHGIREPMEYGFVPEAALALVALGDVERAQRLVAMWDEPSRRVDRAWALAVGARCRALLAAERGEWAAADEALAEAFLQHQRVDMPIELGRTLLLQGQLRRRRRRKASARESFLAAVDLFDRSHAPLWAKRAHEELDRVGRRSQRADGELSATEQRVAELVAAGKTNRQVAAELFISPKTVDSNLVRIYRTLGVQGRAELAARWADRRRSQRRSDDDLAV